VGGRGVKGKDALETSAGPDAGQMNQLFQQKREKNKLLKNKRQLKHEENEQRQQMEE